MRKNPVQYGRWLATLYVAVSLFLGGCASTLEVQEPVKMANRRYELGAQYLDEARYADAINQFTQALSQLSQSEADCKQSPQCEIQDAEAYYHKKAVIYASRAYAYLKLGSDNQSVIADARSAVLLTSDLAEPYLYMGLAYLKMDNREAAWGAYQALNKRNQRLATELYRLYVLKYGSGR